MSKLLDDVVAELSKLPGIGRRTALRLAMYLLREDDTDVAQLTQSIDRFKREIRHCKFCNNLSDEEVCPICNDRNRNRSMVCVVEQVGDVMSIENTRQYNGLYHVLGGVISPMQGISPSDLKIDMLTERVEKGEVKEVILAVNGTVEGETTMFYISKRLSKFENLKISRIARGIGFGDELEYTDEITIAHAIQNRTAVG